MIFITIKEYDNTKEFFLPHELSKYVDENDNCLLAERIVKGMKEDPSFQKVLRKYNREHGSKPGQKAYSMEMLLIIIVAGVIDGVFSARKLSREIKRNTSYMYLTAMQTPDHSTISRFKKKYKLLIKEIFKKVVDMAKEEGMLNLGRIAIDGSKYKANACLQNKIVAKEDYLPDDALNELFTRDDEEDEVYEDETDEMPEKLKEQKQINELIKKQAIEEINNNPDFEVKGKASEEKIQKAKEESIKSQKRVVSTIDPDATLINFRGDKGFYVNTQHAVDGNHFIIGLTVSNSPNDFNQFIPIYEQTNENVGGLPEDCETLMDNGYSTDENIEYCEKHDIDAYIQTRQNAMLNNGTKEDYPFSKTYFFWDNEKQGYWCPNKHLLTYKGETKKNKRKTYYTEKCLTCPDKDKCFKKGKYKRIYDNFTEAQTRMITKMSSEEAQNKYSHRMGMVEHTFGHTKYNLDHRQVSHQGLEDIETEQLLYAINYNTNRYLKLKREQNIINEEKVREKSLQTTLIENQQNIYYNNHEYSINFNQKFWNTNILMKTKAPIT